MGPEIEGNRPTREPLKTHRSDWKDKLRQNCLRRIREERAHLLWKIRSNERQSSADKKEIVQSAFRDIVSDELQKIKPAHVTDSRKNSVFKNDDLLWEYDGLHEDNSIEIESEAILIEMERLLYEELREEMIRRELEVHEEEDDYLARAVFEYMQLNNKKGEKSENKEGEKQLVSLMTPCREKSQSPGPKVSEDDKVWCPVCRQGELREAYHLIYCTGCDLRLDLENDKVNVGFLRDRLGEVHMEHLERGCKAAPSFCMETIFDLTALYIKCQACDTFEIVI